MTTEWLSPDCYVGKCTACSGQAWDDVADAPVDCTHHCHQDPTSLAPDPDDEPMPLLDLALHLFDVVEDVDLAGETLAVHRHRTSDPVRSAELHALTDEIGTAWTTLVRTHARLLELLTTHPDTQEHTL